MSGETLVDTYAEAVHQHTDVLLQHADERSLIYEITGVDGNGTVEVLTLYPGIIVQFHIFHCKAFRFEESKGVSKGVKLNYCSEGRMEVRMSDNMFLFMEPGSFSVDARTTQDSFIFPSEHYHGVEVLIHDLALQGNVPDFWAGLGIDLRKIETMLNENGNCLVKVSDKLKCLFEAMIGAPKGCRIEYLRIKVMELLFLLSERAVEVGKNGSSLMTLGQVEMAKLTMEKIAEDLSRHYSIQSMAEGFGISPTSLKNYFRGVYGKNISVYLRELRMNTAAEALRATNRSVSDIAAEIGYENVSKFAAAFKNFTGEAPLEYRRQSRCGI